MKRILCLLLVLTAAFTVVACDQDKPTAPAATDAATADELPTEATEADEEIDLSVFIKTFDTEPTLEPAVIYDDEGVRITADGITYDPINGPVIGVSAENKLDQPILIQTDSAAVNGYMISPDINFEVKKNSTANGTMTLPYTGLAIADIRCVTEVEFSLRIMDSEKVDTITVTKPIVLKTSAADDDISACDDDGQVAYDDKDVKIVLKGIDERRMFSDGPALMVYMCNSGDKSITVQADEIKVNGCDFTSAMTRSIWPGKRAVDTVTFFDLDMKEYGIEKIDAVELSFHIMDEATWEQIADTGVISVDIKEAE